MGIVEALRKQGYKLEYEYGDGEDHTEVWINDGAGMAARIEWMEIRKMQPAGTGTSQHPLCGKTCLPSAAGNAVEQATCLPCTPRFRAG
jgi:hypothetical protein